LSTITFSAILGLVEIGRAPNDTDPLLYELVDHPPQFSTRDRIDTHAWLIEQQQPWRAQHSAGKAKLLFHTSREGAGETVREAGEIREGENPVEGIRPLVLLDAPHVRVERKIFDYRKIPQSPKRCGM
jgi:hypothetical protein